MHNCGHRNDKHEMDSTAFIAFNGSIYRTRTCLESQTSSITTAQDILADAHIIAAAHTLGRSYGLGQTHHILGPVEDGIILSDEDVAQDPQAVSSDAEAGAAAIVLRLWGRRRVSDEGGMT